MNKKILTIISVTTILTVFVIVASFFLMKEKRKEQNISSELYDLLEKTSTGKGRYDTSNWETYENEKYHFKIKCPDGCEIQESQITQSHDYISFRYGRGLSIHFIPLKKVKYNFSGSKRYIVNEYYSGYSEDEYIITEVQLKNRETIKVAEMSYGGIRITHYIIHRGVLFQIDGMDDVWITNTDLLNDIIIFTD